MNYVTMLLLDKGYFDYDFEKIEREVRWEDTVKSDDEVADLLAMFGMGPRVQEWKKPDSLEEIQEYIIKQENYGS